MVEVEDQSDQHASDRLEFRLDPQAGDSMIAKVIREQGLNYCAVLVKVQGSLTVLKVLSLTPVGIRTAFKFTFLDD